MYLDLCILSWKIKTMTKEIQTGRKLNPAHSNGRSLTEFSLDLEKRDAVPFRQELQ